MPIRHRNDGLRKVCGCPRRTWAKCEHPWHFNFKWNGEPYRFSLDKQVGRRLTSKSEAKAEAERLKTEIRAGKFGQQPVRQVLTVGQLLTQFEKEHVTVRRSASLRNDRYQMVAINRTPVELLTGTIRPFGEWLVADVTPLALERFQAARLTKVTVECEGRGATTGRRFGHG